MRGEHEVIEQLEAHERRCLLQSARDELVLSRRPGFAAGVVVGDEETICAGAQDTREQRRNRHLTAVDRADRDPCPRERAQGRVDREEPHLFTRPQRQRPEQRGHRGRVVQARVRRWSVHPREQPAEGDETLCLSGREASGEELGA